MEPMTLAVHGLAGIALASCCGLRAFLPPFVLGLAVRLGVPELLLHHSLTLNPSFAWIASTPALIVLGTAVVFEFLGDKIPTIDHLLDVAQTFVRPMAGLVVVAATFHQVPPLYAALAGLAIGSTLAAGVHLAKAKIRVLSTLATGGVASPILSIIEDALVIIGSLLAVLLAALAGLLILAGAVATWRAFVGFSRRVGRLQQDLGGRG